MLGRPIGDRKDQKGSEIGDRFNFPRIPTGLKSYLDQLIGSKLDRLQVGSFGSKGRMIELEVYLDPKDPQ